MYYFIVSYNVMSAIMLIGILLNIVIGDCMKKSIQFYNVQWQGKYINDCKIKNWHAY